MVGAYHRRPLVGGRDVAAVGLAKIGSGSAWQGFYMYTGGVNPHGRTGMQESQESGYPNDMPTFDYDFNAPISSTGRLRPSHALLRRQHAFLAAFGERLATMPSTLPSPKPASLGDRTTLRWALRSDGRSGFVFINAHQPYEPLTPEPSRIVVELDDETVVFPPLRIPAGTLAHWPVNLEAGSIRIVWATASVLTLLDRGSRPTLVLVAEDGIPVRLRFAEEPRIAVPTDHASVDGSTLTVDARRTTVVSLEAAGSSLDLLVLSPEDGLRAWVLEPPAAPAPGSSRQLVLASGALWQQADGTVAGRDLSGSARVQRYDPAERRLVYVHTEIGNPAVDTVLTTTLLRPAAAVGVDAYGEHDRRYSAPSAEDRAALSARIHLSLPPDLDDRDAELQVTWEGDVLQLVVDGVPVYDQFWTGQQFVVNLRDAGVTSRSDVVLELLPLHPDANIFVSPAAQRVRDRSAGPIGAVHEARLIEPGRWHERSFA
jgi:hypothetical protein